LDQKASPILMIYHGESATVLVLHAKHLIFKPDTL